MLVDDGRVVARAPRVEIPPRLDELIDHDGKLFIPAFIDNHCHIIPAGLNLHALNLASARSVEKLLDAVRDRHESNPDGWLVCVQYDHNRLGRHVTLPELDAISAVRPILLRHASGHAAVANSAAFAAAGIVDSVCDPEGGSFERDASGRLSGVVTENALGHLMRALPEPPEHVMVDAIVQACKSMHRWGIHAAADMMTGEFNLIRELRAYRTASDQGCPVLLRLYVQWSRLFGPRAVGREEIEDAMSGCDPEKCRIVGVKIFADGAIGASTAAIYGGYEGRPVAEGQFAGTRMYKPERLKSMVRTAADAGYQVAVHSIGDHATDLVLDAFEATDEPSRHRLEHAMLLSDAQIERIAKIGCHVTFQPEFLMRFGQAYARQLGQARASKLLRSRSAIDAGLRLSFSSDRPITSGDPWDGIAASSNRPAGFDQSENCTRIEAIEAYTKRAAEAMGDGKLMGSLAPGMLADYQVIDADSL